MGIQLFIWRKLQPSLYTYHDKSPNRRPNCACLASPWRRLMGFRCQDQHNACCIRRTTKTDVRLICSSSKCRYVYGKNNNIPEENWFCIHPESCLKPLRPSLIPLPTATRQLLLLTEPRVYQLKSKVPSLGTLWERRLSSGFELWVLPTWLWLLSRCCLVFLLYSLEKKYMFKLSMHVSYNCTFVLPESWKCRLHMNEYRVGS